MLVDFHDKGVGHLGRHVHGQQGKVVEGGVLWSHHCPGGTQPREREGCCWTMIDKGS